MKKKSKITKDKVVAIIGAIVLAGKCALDVIDILGDKNKKK